jgi:hypothetical protein
VDKDEEDKKHGDEPFCTSTDLKHLIQVTVELVLNLPDAEDAEDLCQTDYPIDLVDSGEACHSIRIVALVT